MSIIATERSSVKRDYPTAPAGMHQAVCVEIRDLGLQDVTWEGKTRQVHKILVAWEIEPEYTYEDSEGAEHSRRHMLFERYTLTLSPKGKLRGVLEDWLGRDLTPAECEGFDLASMVGEPCQISVSHREGGNGKTYANVKTIVPASEANGLLPSGKYKAGQSEEEPSTDLDDLPI